MDFSDIMILTVVSMGSGVVIGAAIQRVTKFLDPIDFFTIGILLAIPVMAVVSSAIPAVPYIPWSWPFAAGYIVGYIVAGHTQYTMLRLFTGAKTTYAEPYVLWKDKSGWYLQEQSWRALGRRLFLGIRHEVVCTNGTLEPDWIDITKWPHMPLRKHGEIMADSVETYCEEVPGHARRRRYVTVIRRAPGSCASTVDLVRDFDALAKTNSALIEAQNRVFRLEQSLNIRLADSVAYFLSTIYSKAPGAAFLDVLREWESSPAPRAENEKTEKEADNGSALD